MRNEEELSTQSLVPAGYPALPALIDLEISLAQAEDDLERLRIRNDARYAVALAEVLGRRDIQTRYSVLVQDAEREIHRANPPAQGRRTDLNLLASDTEVIPIHTIWDIRRAHSSVTDEEYADIRQTAIEHNEPLRRKDLLVPHIARATGQVEWYTPPAIVEAARTCMGGIDLDPASSAKAQETVQATHFFDKYKNGLNRKWFGKVFLNPPYTTGLISQFVGKAVFSPDIEKAIVLVNNATETRWAQRLMEASTAVCFLSSRVRFLDSEANEARTPLQGQMLVGLKIDRHDFEAAFSSFGICVYGKRTTANNPLMDAIWGSK